MKFWVTEHIFVFNIKDGVDERLSDMTQNQLALLVPDSIIRNGVEGLIKANGYTRYSVIVFEDFQALIRHASAVDILLLDTSEMHIDTVANHLGRLAQCCSTVRIIVISNQLKVVHIKRIMQLGAKGFIFRDDLSNALMSSIDLVARDVVTMSAQALQLLTNTDQLYMVNDLKPVDMHVLRLTARGLTVKAIAAELDISTRSVYRSRDKLREILAVQTIETLIDAAREQGLLDFDDA
jgi:DNA-binding NarL/FixJ family response regulator